MIFDSLVYIFYGRRLQKQQDKRTKNSPKYRSTHGGHSQLGSGPSITTAYLLAPDQIYVGIQKQFKYPNQKIQLPKNKIILKKILLNNKEDLMNSPHSPKSSVIYNLMVKARFEVLAVWANTDKHLQVQQAHCSRLTQW